MYIILDDNNTTDAHVEDNIVDDNEISKINLKLGRLENVIFSLQDKVAELEEEINTLKNEQTMLAVKSKASSVEPMGKPEFDTETGAQVFEYVWVIEDFENLNETYEEDDVLRSPRFYIGPRSYRMFMATYPIGRSSQPAILLEFVNIYGGIARGAYDDVLTWPFNLRYDLILLDQTNVNPNHVEVAIWPGKTCTREEMWEETILDRYQSTNACGMPTLIEKDQLRKGNYIKDGKLMFKMKVYFN